MEKEMEEIKESQSAKKSQKKYGKQKDIKKWHLIFFLEHL